ncbi:MAG: outer membrane beta-barrel protein [Bacteroidota bacterium]
MYRHRTVTRNLRVLSRWSARIILSSLVLMGLSATGFSQDTQRDRPTWWYGGVFGGNLNFYSGTTQMLNASLTSPAPFHKGFGAGFYFAGLLEYRPNPVWGGILQVGYDDRRASFSDVPCPCGEIATLSTTISYLSIEPSIRFAPFSDRFYIYAGPRIGFNWAPNLGSGSQADESEFHYTQEGVTAARGQWSDMNKTVFSGQIGLGYDIPFRSSSHKTQFNFSPFISYHPYFGQDPRSAGGVENWGVSTLRMGFALKFGDGDEIPQSIPMAERDVWFSVRAPKAVPVKRRVRETFPLRNYVFFEEGSTQIPGRYVFLSKEQAANFKEEQLQEAQPTSNVGLSLRQMTVYYNILNVIGDRMKRSSATVTLHGASANGAEHGKARAESVKRYLVETFGIAESRISTEGRVKPLVPSELPGATKELAFLRAGDSRVDIESSSPELTMQIGGAPHHYGLKPVQVVDVVEDPLDSHVLFNVVGAKDVLASWTVELTDNQGKVQRFGPSTREQENVSGNVILGDKARGDYKVVMLGQSKTGKLIRKEASVSLVRRADPATEAIRFRILFGFDESESVVRYQTFLMEVVAPLIPNNGVVVIHGYTDLIGEEEYNDNLSYERVRDTQRILERVTSSKRGITYETLWFGENLQYSQFDNNLPEGRFYNRSVVIDVVPD